jgi:ABC-type nitrate/sulfonate/bicarbonate transport system permease component
MTKQALVGLFRWYPLLLALAAWEALAHSGLVHPLLAPPLETIWAALAKGIANGNLLYHAEWTLARAGIGFGCAIVAGIAIGSAMALSGRFEEAIEPIFVFGYPIPKIAFYPIFAFLFGLGSGPKVALVFLECLYPVAISTYQGIKTIGDSDVWAARMMGANGWQIYLKVILPRAAPYIMSSLRVSAHIALATVVILEMIGDSTGLGYYISYTAASFDFGTSFAAVALIVAIGFAIDRLLIVLRRRAMFWERDDAQAI